MKTLLVLFALNTIKLSHLIPLGGFVGGGVVKQGGFAVGPAESHYAEGSAGGVGGVAGGGGFSASFGGGAVGGGAVGGGGGGVLGGGGTVVKTVTVEEHVAPAAHGYVHGAGAGIGGGGASGGASFSASFGGVSKHVHGGRAEVISEKVLEVETEAPLPLQPAKKTVIERTFIPNYVEKKIQVPTYVEKTIRVPTYVEKTIKVPAAPTVVEKTISQEDVPAPVNHKAVLDARFSAEGGAVDNVHVYNKVKVRPHKIYHKEVISTGGGGAGYAGYGGDSGYGGGAGGGGFHAYASGGGSGGGLFDGIFNIPIQTLGAVKNFLNNLSGGFSAQGGFAKGFSTY